jgi:hypothetical protein
MILERQNLTTMVVVAKGAAMVFLVPLLEWENIGFTILLFSIASIFCLVVSLLILIVFQSWMHFETRMQHFLLRVAHRVYGIHPAVVCSTTALYITLYNDYTMNDDPITFGEQDSHSPFAPMGQGGGNSYLVFGWVLVNLSSHLVV